jgi:hypothetical protein
MDKLLEEFIKDWRLKNNSKDAIYSSYHYDAMIEFAKHYHSQQLILSGVSQQRELLLAYNEEVNQCMVDSQDILDERDVNEFLANNCG